MSCTHDQKDAPDCIAPESWNSADRKEAVPAKVARLAETQTECCKGKRPLVGTQGSVPYMGSAVC